MLESITKWRPFRIDALGIVTMLGADEIDRAVGRLVPNMAVEYLPLLGAFVISGNRFVQPIPGNVIYNITDGIMAADVSGWLSRWLLDQNPRWSTTTYSWEIRRHGNSLWRRRVLAVVIGIVVNAGLVIFTALARDWFGLANAMSMAISVFVRAYLVHENREFLDRAVTGLNKNELEVVKIFCTLSDGKAVTILAPRGLVTGCFLTTPRPAQPGAYNLIRALGWLALACHVISIGQCTLFTQLLTVVTMIGATTLLVLGIASNDFLICRNVRVCRSDMTALEDRRTSAYANFGMVEKEEDAMLAWGLMPQRSNVGWWAKYSHLKGGLEAARLGHLSWSQAAVQSV